jgi:hypothetical protein
MWLEQNELPFDKSILKGFYKKLNSPNGKFLFQIAPEELEHFEKMVDHVNKRLHSELIGPLRNIYPIYDKWEKQNKINFIKLSAGMRLSPLIKDGGPKAQIEETKDGIIVPSELYVVLYWRQQTQDAKQALAQKNLGNIRTLLPIFSHFFKT